MKTVTCRHLGRTMAATLALLITSGAASCAGSGSTAGTAAEVPAAVGSTSSLPTPSSAQGLRLFRPADPDAVAIANRFIAAYNRGPHALSQFWDYSGKTSSLWADNGWLRPNCLSKEDVCIPVGRLSPVLEVGKFQKTELRGQKPAPVLLAFRINNGFMPTWILEFSPDGRHVSNLWVS